MQLLVLDTTETSINEIQLMLFNENFAFSSED